MSGLPSNPKPSFVKRNPHIYAGAGLDTQPKARLPVSDATLDTEGDRASIKLNKLETAYWAHLLTLGVKEIHVQAITLKLANDCRLTCDFTYRDTRGVLVFVDVKGFQREDALLKMKFAKQTFPEFRFVIVKREDGEWKGKEMEL